MKSHESMDRGRAVKLVIMLLTMVILLTAVMAQVGVTLAAPKDIEVFLECESGIGESHTIEVGDTRTAPASPLFNARSSDPGIAAVDFVPGGEGEEGSIIVTGTGAGVASISYANEFGIEVNDVYQITDPANISAYRIKDGGEVYFSNSGFTKTSSVIIPAGHGEFSRISWSSTNTEVAEVTANGIIRSTGVGIAVIIGVFTDKWGEKRDVHLFVGVGVKLSDGNYAKLLELIQDAKNILAEKGEDGKGSPYTTKSLIGLNDALQHGKNTLNNCVLHSPETTEEEILAAAAMLREAVKKMEKYEGERGNILGPDKDGYYYMPAGNPLNVYEALDSEQKCLEECFYVFNTGDPSEDPGSNRRAWPDRCFYYVETPEGSNIFKKVDNDGSLRDARIVWGGEDREFGSDDDQKVYLFEAEGEDGNTEIQYWIHLGQNIKRQILGPAALGPLTGGGPDKDPTTNPVRPVFDNTAADGQYYIGPLGPPGPESDEYYYGDSLDSGRGNNMVLSTAKERHYTDDKFYLVNGEMVTTKPRG